MEVNETAWKDSREDVIEADLMSHHFSTICQLCFVNDPVVSCNLCREQYLCDSCDDEIHFNYPLHNRRAYLNECLYDLAPCEVFVNSQIVEKGTSSYVIYILDVEFLMQI